MKKILIRIIKFILYLLIAFGIYVMFDNMPDTTDTLVPLFGFLGSFILGLIYNKEI